MFFYKKRCRELEAEQRRLHALLGRVYFETLYPTPTYVPYCTVDRLIEGELDRRKDLKATQAKRQELERIIDARIRLKAQDERSREQV